tara:strand:- start:17316 stop:17822 length:507 start_codon:yes stop_codon:yes gene_type:complete
MADFDILTFLEYYPDKSSVLDSNAKRSPTNAYQNFYQSAQNLTADSAIDQTMNFTYLAFDASGYASTEANSINDLKINIAATADIVDLTETAMTGDRLVIASLYVQSIGQDIFSNSASLVSRFIGTIESATINETTVIWNVSTAISKQKAQVPTKKISSDLLGRFIVP